MNNGTLIVKTYVSNAYVPLEDVIVYITYPDETRIGSALTNKNGETTVFVIPTPNEATTEDPNAEVEPFTKIDVYAYKEGYYLMKIENVQIFDGIESIESIQMVPLQLNEENQTRTMIITPQELGNSSNE